MASQEETQDPNQLQNPTAAALEQFAGKQIQEILIGRLQRGNFVPLKGQSAATILRVMSTRVNDKLDGLKIQNDIRNLVRERSIAADFRAVASGDGVILWVLVEPIDQLFDELRFVGVRKFTSIELEQILDVDTNQPVSRMQAESLRDILLARYRREGYYFVSIAVEDESAPMEPFAPRTEFRTLFLRVDEGPQVTVRNVYFRGNDSFKGSEPFSLFYRSELLTRDTQIKSNGRSGFISGDPFSLEVVQEDLDRIRTFYRERGFRDADVYLAAATPTADREEMDLTFRVVEGQRYRIETVELERLNSTYETLPEEEALYPREEIVRELRLKAGDFYDSAKITADMRFLRRYYGERGHPSSRRIPESLEVLEPEELVDPTKKTIRMFYRVREGTPKFLREIRIQGNTYTQDRVIRRKLIPNPGDRVNVADIDRSRGQLLRTRYFDSQRFRSQLRAVPGKEDLVDWWLDAKDGDTGRLRWGVALSTEAGVQATLRFNKANFDITNLPSSPNPLVWIPELLDSRAFHGAGQSLDLLVAPGTQVSQFSLAFTEPDIFRDHQDIIGMTVAGSRNLRRFVSYTTDILRASVALRRQFTEQTSVSLTLSHETVDLDNPDPNAPLVVFESEGQSELRTTQLRWTYSDLDRPRQLAPTEGFRFTAYGANTGGPWGGDQDYWRTGASADFYTWFREDLEQRRHVIHLRSQFDYGKAYDDTNFVYPTDRLFMGGFRTLRGFDFREAGPSQFGRPTGGEARFLARAEYFFPLVGTASSDYLQGNELIRGVVFSDFGLLGTELDDDTFSEPRLSAGFGVRISVPVLNVPIALDLGWPILFEDSDDRRQFSFSLSYQ